MLRINEQGEIEHSPDTQGRTWKYNAILSSVGYFKKSDHHV